MGKNKIPETGIYDARQLGRGRMLLLGFQHMFAMFGATILVPILTGLDVSNTLLFAGLGTLLFHLITGGKVPAFLGSSFAFLGGYATIAPMLGEQQNIPNLEMLPYACFGVACAGLVYVILAGLFKVFGAKKVMRFFPPIVTGPIIIAIGLNLSSSAINNCTGSWWIAIAAILIIVAANIWGKGMIKIIPILLGVIGSYLLAVIFDADVRANLVANVSEAKWFALPIKMEQTVFGLFASGNVDAHKLLTAVITIVPLSLATMVEHIGDVSAISSTCNRNYIENPGLHRTLMGDGLATTLAALFGAPANTTYGENTGVLALSRIYDPRVIRIAAVLAMLFSFSPKFAAVISSMPGGTIGGVSLVRSRLDVRFGLQPVEKDLDRLPQGTDAGGHGIFGNKNIVLFPLSRRDERDVPLGLQMGSPFCVDIGTICIEPAVCDRCAVQIDLLCSPQVAETGFADLYGAGDGKLARPQLRKNVQLDAVIPQVLRGISC